MILNCNRHIRIYNKKQFDTMLYNGFDTTYNWYTGDIFIHTCMNTDYIYKKWTI